MKKAVFFDRDNTIIEDIPYNGDPDKVILMQGALEAMKHCQYLGYELIIITNQSGVGRGYISENDMHRVNCKVEGLLQDGGVVVKKFYNCIHSPGDNCACRKPQPELLLRAASDLGVSLQNSFMIGDKLSDIEAGYNAGCKLNILISGITTKCDHCMIVNNIRDIEKIIRS